MFCSCGTSNAKFTKLFQNDKVFVIQDTENGSINEKIEIAGLNSLKCIGDDLYYNIQTKIVYWWNGNFSSDYYDSSTMPTAYYGPNGRLCKYDPDTKTLYEIKN